MDLVVLPDGTRDSSIVVLLDWKGRVVWYSDEVPSLPVGDLAVDYVREDYRQPVREVIRRVIDNREEQRLHVVNRLEEHHRVWFWPLDSPEVAACALAIRVPPELELLTARERDCLKLLAEGNSAATIAEELEIAVTTVHTHFRRAREKLILPSLEALVIFASRYCATPTCPDVGQSLASNAFPG